MIERLVSDSRRCGPGAAFFAWPGDAADGRRFIAQAIRRSAAAVVWDTEGFTWDPAWTVPNVGVKGLRQRAGELAHAFYGRPSETMWVCGVTGTNGKTTCSQWLAAALRMHGAKSGVIGTLGAGLEGEFELLQNTTPDAIELHRLLASMRERGATAVAMEVSSHGLVQGRVNGIAFDCALLTNLSHDHLDYHGTMDAYARAKARLFDTAGLACAVLNLDDVFGVRLAQRLGARGIRTMGYALSQAAVVPDSVSQYAAALDVSIDDGGLRVSIGSSWGDFEVRLPHLGRYNVANALGVFGALIAYGIEAPAAARLLEALPPVTGRMQRVGGNGRPLAVIDYAHTPDALEKALAALRPAADAAGGRLTAVFGAGGDRDPSKRSLMGAAAARFADAIVITSDNPRSEDPLAIIAAIREGVPQDAGTDVHIEPDRARAIALALGGAAADDVILIAGKGHEDYQERGGHREPFSDAAEASLALERWSAGGRA
ncbi:MAG: UDP-N-acetylmuramoyl-L-alanyl-D-glutamate--2,6-diaminopimelate ligase [Betaproteobacteria bacterium]|nr:UDP-N-acetylmuramoyl-L-alanyl-D-glutamate--2,6-diaminopimelate ligase [Betaproteobacteria bacterium]